jgi:hypothetical protein
MNKEDRGAPAWAAMVAAVVNRFSGGFQALILETQIIRPYDTRAIHGSIMEVQGIAGAFAGLFFAKTVIGYTPSEWKGSIKGDVMTERIKKLMTKEDWSVFETAGKTYDHNTIDAVGIGFHHFGRFARHRVYAR